MASVAAATHLHKSELLPKECGMTGKQRTLKEKVDDMLDQALQDSFPASDPVSFLEPAPLKGGDRKLPVVEAGKESGRLPRGRSAKATRS
jgi:hypothetical protein